MAMGVQGKMIEAAARAGVKWILPTEYAGDGLNEGMVEAVPLFHPKREARRQIEELSKEKECEGVKWIGVATGPWVEAVSFAAFLSPHSLGFDLCSSPGRGGRGSQTVATINETHISPVYRPFR